MDTSSSLVLEQFYAFLESLVVGITLGACFDLYRALRLQGKRRITVLSVITDCLFWIGAAAACIAVIIVRRWGEVYLYNYLAIAGGFAGYINFFSRFLLPLWFRLFGLILHCIISLYCFLVKVVLILVTPFLWVIGRAGKIFSKLYSRISGYNRRRTS